MTLLCTVLGLMAVASARPAEALEPHERPGWYVGLGFGVARSGITDYTGDHYWDTGMFPQVRLGKMLGQHFAIGLDAQTWFNEIGTAGDDLPLQLKIRFTGHLWSLAGTWYPGPRDGSLGGLFVRAGTGPAIGNYAAAIPDPSDPLGAREIQARIDEWGWGVMYAVGYEARVAEHFAAGIQISSNHLWIDEGIDRSWYGGPALHLLWYF